MDDKEGDSLCESVAYLNFMFGGGGGNEDVTGGGKLGAAGALPPPPPPPATTGGGKWPTTGLGNAGAAGSVAGGAPNAGGGALNTGGGALNVGGGALNVGGGALSTGGGGGAAAEASAAAPSGLPSSTVPRLELEAGAALLRLSFFSSFFLRFSSSSRRFSSSFLRFSSSFLRLASASGFAMAGGGAEPSIVPAGWRLVVGTKSSLAEPVLETGGGGGGLAVALLPPTSGASRGDLATLGGAGADGGAGTLWRGDLLGGGAAAASADSDLAKAAAPEADDEADDDEPDETVMAGARIVVPSPGLSTVPTPSSASKSNSLPRTNLAGIGISAARVDAPVSVWQSSARCCRGGGDWRHVPATVCDVTDEVLVPSGPKMVDAWRYSCAVRMRCAAETSSRVNKPTIGTSDRVDGWAVGGGAAVVHVRCWRRRAWPRSGSAGRAAG